MSARSALRKHLAIGVSTAFRDVAQERPHRSRRALRAGSGGLSFIDWKTGERLRPVTAA